MGGAACTWMLLGSICNTGWEVRKLQGHHPSSSYFDFRRIIICNQIHQMITCILSK